MTFYLFPGEMYRRIGYSSRIMRYLCGNSLVPNAKLKNSYKIYYSSLKQYAGFGVLLQFFSGTTAARARRQLSKDLKPHLKKIVLQLAQSARGKRPFGYRYFLIIYLHASFSYFISLDIILSGFLFKVFSGFKRPMINYKNNRLLPWLMILLSFPLLRNIVIHKQTGYRFHKNTVKLIIRNLLNPILLIIQLVQFAHNVVNRVLEIGSSAQHFSLPRFILKSLVGLVFGVVQLPLHVVNVPFEQAKLLLFSPLVELISHFIISVQEAYRDTKQHKSRFIATAKELQEIKELKKKAGSLDDTSYATISKAKNCSLKHARLKQEKSYSQNFENPERLVAIRADSKKIAKLAALFSIVKANKTNADRVEEARYVLGNRSLVR